MPLLLAIMFFFSSLTYADTPITVVSDPWCPFICNEAQHKQGLVIDLSSAALKASINKSIQLESMSWARSKIFTQKGKRDAIAGIERTDKNKGLFTFPKTSLGRSKICLFKRRGNPWQFLDGPSLNHQRLGWVNHYIYGPKVDFLDAHIEKLQRNNSKFLTIISGNNHIHKRLLNMIIQDRIDVIAEDYSVIKHTIAQDGLTKIINMAGCIESSETFVYLAFSSKIPHAQHYADALDNGIKDIIKSGQASKILARYGLTVEESIQVHNWH